jgi:hypothetical protein
MRTWQKIYGPFDNFDYRSFRIKVPNESGFYAGELVAWAKTVASCMPSNERILLAGDNNEVKPFVQKIVLNENIVTTGLSNVDYTWNFENNPPLNIGKFNLIISQAMLEHLLNPYQHICDLANLLVKGGYLILHTCIPGMPYHRFPIDAQRFFPDWFEEIAHKLGLAVIKKRVHNTQIYYMLRKKPIDGARAIR